VKPRLEAIARLSKTDIYFSAQEVDPVRAVAMAAPGFGEKEGARRRPFAGVRALLRARGRARNEANLRPRPTCSGEIAGLRPRRPRDEQIGPMKKRADGESRVRLDVAGRDPHSCSRIHVSARPRSGRSGRTRLDRLTSPSASSCWPGGGQARWSSEVRMGDQGRLRGFGNRGGESGTYELCAARQASSAERVRPELRRSIRGGPGSGAGRGRARGRSPWCGAVSLRALLKAVA
jgi:hypothetical protein